MLVPGQETTVCHPRIPLDVRFCCRTDLNSSKSIEPDASLPSAPMTNIAELYSHIEYRESQLVVGIGLHCQLGIEPRLSHKPFSALPISMWLILLRLNSQVSKTTNSSNDTSPLLEVSATRNT